LLKQLPVYFSTSRCTTCLFKRNIFIHLSISRAPICFLKKNLIFQYHEN
jgi:hypothetical protein